MGKRIAGGTAAQFNVREVERSVAFLRTDGIPVRDCPRCQRRTCAAVIVAGAAAVIVAGAAAGLLVAIQTIAELAIDGCCHKVRLRRLRRIGRQAMVFAGLVCTGIAFAFSTGLRRFDFFLGAGAVAFAFCKVTPFGTAGFALHAAFAVGALSRVNRGFAGRTGFRAYFKEAAAHGRA